MLRSRDGVALRRIDHEHTTLGGCGHVNVVHAYTGATNNLELRRCGNHLSGDLRSRTDHQTVVIADHADQLLGRESRALIDLRHLTENVDSGLVDRIGYQNFRHQWGAALPR